DAPSARRSSGTESRSRLLRDVLQVREALLEVGADQAVHGHREVVLERIGADVARAGPGDLRAGRGRFERERAAGFQVEVGEHERVLDAPVGLDADELHLARALAGTLPRPPGALAEGRTRVADLHLRVALVPRAPLRPQARIGDEVVDA